MQDQLDTLSFRVGTLEQKTSTHMEQTTRIEQNTTDLLETFNALKGAWKVLNAIGKLAKPLTFIAALFGSYYAWRNGVSK
jgi:hypothetical protein